MARLFLRDRTRRAVDAFLARYGGVPTPDPALPTTEVAAALRKVADDLEHDGVLGPTATARALRDAARLAEAMTAAAQRRIDATTSRFGAQYATAEVVVGEAAVRVGSLEADQRALPEHDHAARTLHGLADEYARRARAHRGYPDVGRLEDERDVVGLCRALTDPRVELRAHAVEALGRLQAPEAVGVLVALLRADAADGTSPLLHPVVRALGAIGSPRAVDALVTVLEERAADNTAAADALAALGRLGDRRAVPAVAHYLSHGFWGIYAVRALGEIGDPAAVPALREYATAKRWGSDPERRWAKEATEVADRLADQPNRPDT